MKEGQEIILVGVEFGVGIDRMGLKFIGLTFAPGCYSSSNSHVGIGEVCKAYEAIQEYYKKKKEYEDGRGPDRQDREEDL